MSETGYLVADSRWTAPQVCEHTEDHGPAHCTWVKCMLCDDISIVRLKKTVDARLAGSYKQTSQRY